MSSKRYLAFILIVIAVNIFTTCFFGGNDNSNYNETIIKLEQENLKLQEQNSKLDQDILKRKKKSDSLKLKLDQSNRIIQNLHYELQQKIHFISRMSDVELYEYFANFRTDSTKHKRK
jgi:peptidoglycan hydrolase CwlO-like protein